MYAVFLTKSALRYNTVIDYFQVSPALFLSILTPTFTAIMSLLQICDEKLELRLTIEVTSEFNHQKTISQKKDNKMHPVVT